MKKQVKIIIIIVLLTLSMGCSYSLFENAFPHLRNIQIATFENNTSEYALAQDLQESLVNTFQRDGRLRITTRDPDSFIDGSILDYRNEIHSYDIFGNISEYRVTILFSVSFTDMRFNDVIYENNALRLSETYSPSANNPELLTTEAQAIQSIFDDLFTTIIRNTLEAW
jgi:hypothetical protein